MTARSAACRTRRLAVATLLALVAALHLLLLAGAAERPASGPRVAALVVRRIVVDSPAAPAPAAPRPAAMPPPAAARGRPGGPVPT
ncbi:hypothetical protein CLD22_23720, partial [Rubrivivax gelatinosus]|nr:hypothetical protein [Rubrivivax gelatinosus]